MVPPSQDTTVGQPPQIIETDELATTYAAVSLYLRLLRAAVAYAVVGFGLILLVALVVAAVSPGPAVAVVLVVVVLLAGVAGLLALVFVRASRGSMAVARVVLVLACLFILGGLAGLVIHAVRVITVDDAGRGAELVQAAQELLPIYVALGLGYGSLGVVRSRRIQHIARSCGTAASGSGCAPTPTGSSACRSLRATIVAGSGVLGASPCWPSPARASGSPCTSTPAPTNPRT